MVEKRPKTFKGSKPAVKKTAARRPAIKKAPAKKVVKNSPKKTAPVIEKEELVSISVQTIEEPISDASIHEEIKEGQSAPIESSSTPIQSESTGTESEQTSIESESEIETTPVSEDVSSTEESPEDTSISSEKAMQGTSSVPPFTPHFENSQDNEPMPKKRRVLLIVIVFIVLLLLIIAAIFGYLYVSKKSSVPFLGNDVVHVKHVDVSPKPATPTPTKAVDRTAYDIEVLNGSGKSGEASKVKTLLTGENFIVSDTGNADRYTYTETIIEAKKTVDKSFLTELKNVLSQDYVVASTSSLLNSSSPADVVVTVGRE